MIYEDKETGLYKIGKNGKPEHQTREDARNTYRERKLQEIRKNLNKIRGL